MAVAGIVPARVAGRPAVAIDLMPVADQARVLVRLAPAQVRVPTRARVPTQAIALVEDPHREIVGRKQARVPAVGQRAMADRPRGS